MPSFREDGELLSELRDALAKRNDRLNPGPRALAARNLIRRGQKVVAFTSTTEAAYDLQRDMERTNGLPMAPIFLLVRDLDPGHVDQILERLRMETGAAVLIADATGEEGLNLHFADGLIHADLPFSPVRLEQRIGRLDRYGRKRPDIEHVVTLPSDATDSPWKAWLDLLNDGFELFSKSLSEVQFLLPELEPLLEQELFLRGADGLRSLVPSVRERLKDEQTRLDEQYALDKMDATEGDSAPLFDSLRGADADEAAFAEPLDRWWTHGLQLERHVDSTRPDVFWVRWKPSTQVPNVPWRELFRAGLDTPLTFRRQVAVTHPAVKLVRPGMPLVDRQQEYLSWDDRGTAFATWRRILAWKRGSVRNWRGFRLSFLVEADVAAAEQQLSSRGDKFGVDRLSQEEVARALPNVRRRADALFPPSVSVIHLGADDLRIVDDPALLETLELPYSDPRLGEQYRDYNIGRNTETLSAVIDLDEFQDLCRDVRSQAEAALRAEAAFATRVANAAKEAERLIGDQNARLRRRHSAVLAETGADDASLRREIAVNEVLFACARKPRIHLDSIGFIILTNDEPPAAAMGAQ